MSEMSPQDVQAAETDAYRDLGVTSRDWDGTEAQPMRLEVDKVFCFCGYCHQVMFIGEEQHTDIEDLREAFRQGVQTLECRTCGHWSAIPANVPTFPLRDQA